MDDLLHNEIAEAGREQDALLSEHQEWLARREAASGAPVQKPDDPAVLYREHNDDNALPPAPEPDAEPSDDEAYPPLDDLREAIAEFTVEWVAKTLAPRDERLTRLEAKVDALLTLLGQKPTKLWTPGNGA